MPLLAGWNRDEGSADALFDKDPPTIAHYPEPASAKFGRKANAFLSAFPATTDAEAKRAAQDFGGDQFIAHGTWIWMDLQLQTGKSPVDRYEFDQTLRGPSDWVIPARPDQQDSSSSPMPWAIGARPRLAVGV